MCTFIEGEKAEVAHQVITKNTHSDISLLPDFSGNSEEGRITGKALLRILEGGIHQGSYTQKKPAHLGQETSVHETKI